MLALSTEITSEAFAETSRVITDTATRAIATLLITVTHKNIGTRRALFKRAIWTAEPKITHAANMLHSIPRLDVGLSRLSSQLLLRVANTPRRTVVRTHSTLTTNAIIVVKAFTFPSLTVANALIRAFYFRVRFVRGSSYRNPRSSLRACAQRTIMLRPSSITIWSLIANAFVIPRARSVSGASIWTVCVRDGHRSRKGE